MYIVSELPALPFQVGSGPTPVSSEDGVLKSPLGRGVIHASVGSSPKNADAITFSRGSRFVACEFKECVLGSSEGCVFPPEAVKLSFFWTPANGWLGVCESMSHPRRINTDSTNPIFTAPPRTPGSDAKDQAFWPFGKS